MKESELKNIIIKKVGDLEGYTKEVERYFFSKINFISLEREIHNCNKAIFNFPYEVIIDNYPDDEVTIEEDYTSKYIELYLEYAYQIMIRIPLQTYISILESVQLYQDDQFLNNKKRKQRILNFENGLRHGDWVYYHNEIISVKGSYRNGKKVGKLQEYSSNGKILKEINYEYNDVRRYLEKKWFASGNLCQDWDLNDEGIIVINKFNEEGKIIYNSLHEDSGNIISKKGEYLDNKGELVQFETEFSSDKKTTNYIKEGRLCSKYEIDSLNKKITTRRYNENGELESETIRKDGKQIYSYLKEN